MTVLAVEDEGNFDFIDVASMQPTSHIGSLGNLSKSFKTRLTQKAGGLAIADAKGFYFAEMTSENNGHHMIKLTNDHYEQNHAVNDFVEYKRDSFLVTVIGADYFCIVERNIEGGIFGSSSKTTKIKSMHPGVISLGIGLIPGPRLDQTSFAVIRDRRGIQLVNLKKATSH